MARRKRIKSDYSLEDWMADNVATYVRGNYIQEDQFWLDACATFGENPDQAEQGSDFADRFFNRLSQLEDVELSYISHDDDGYDDYYDY